MIFDKQLAAACRAASRGDAERSARVERLLDEWERACALSRGPVKQRAAHWQVIAEDKREWLERIAGSNYEGVKQCVGR